MCRATKIRDEILQSKHDYFQGNKTVNRERGVIFHEQIEKRKRNEMSDICTICQFIAHNEMLNTQKNTVLSYSNLHLLLHTSIDHIQTKKKIQANTKKKTKPMFSSCQYFVS